MYLLFKASSRLIQWPEPHSVRGGDSSSVTSSVVLVHSRGKSLSDWVVFAAVAKAQLCSYLRAVPELGLRPFDVGNSSNQRKFCV